MATAVASDGQVEGDHGDPTAEALAGEELAPAEARATAARTTARNWRRSHRGRRPRHDGEELASAAGTTARSWLDTGERSSASYPLRCVRSLRELRRS
jgi:hypothetical protein